MITLYGFGRIFRPVIGETRDLRAQWALEETGLPYRVHGLDHTGGELDGPAYSEINCFHLVPAIDDDGFIVAESAAVLVLVYMFVANLGSVKLDSAYHHLYEYGNCPFFAALGRTQTVVTPDGPKQMCSIKYSFDERVEDGLYCAKGLELLKQRMEDPAGSGTPA